LLKIESERSAEGTRVSTSALIDIHPDELPMLPPQTITS
jgi:hypothetical protein